MVDFALMTPILILFLMGVVDFSVAVARSSELTSAVQEGLGYAKAHPHDASLAANTLTRMNREGANLTLTSGNVVITCYQGLSTTPVTGGCVNAVYGDSVKVQGTFNYTPITGRLIAIAGNPLAITQSATAEIY